VARFRRRGDGGDRGPWMVTAGMAMAGMAMAGMAMVPWRP